MKKIIIESNEWWLLENRLGIFYDCSGVEEERKVIDEYEHEKKP